jgi:hypothetical protein
MSTTLTTTADFCTGEVRDEALENAGGNGRF